MSNTPLPVPASDAPLGPAARTGNTAFATSIALLLLRLFLGWAFIYHGSQKLFGAFGGKGLDAFAHTLHMPAFLPPTAWAALAAGSEFVCGILIFIGLLARFASIPIICVMLVAIATVHGQFGFATSFKDGKTLIGYELNLAYITLCTTLLLTGPGLISLDALFFRRGLWAKGAQPLANPGTRSA
jgi:putative oxidoreductase